MNEANLDVADRDDITALVTHEITLCDAWRLRPSASCLFTWTRRSIFASKSATPPGTVKPIIEPPT